MRICTLFGILFFCTFRVTLSIYTTCVNALFSRHVRDALCGWHRTCHAWSRGTIFVCDYWVFTVNGASHSFSVCVYLYDLFPKTLVQGAVLHIFKERTLSILTLTSSKCFSAVLRVLCTLPCSMELLQSVIARVFGFYFGVVFTIPQQRSEKIITTSAPLSKNAWRTQIFALQVQVQVRI